jgi:hypothetical protein
VTTGRLLFDTLRFHGAPPSERLAAAWASADVRGLPRLVALEGCAIWVYRRLRQVGALEQMDRDLADWLASQATDQTARNLLIDAEADALAEIFQRIGVPAVFMKGVARRLLAARFPLADARSTHDVDLIVPAERAWEVWHELRRLGYGRTRLTKPPRPEHHHLPALMGERRVGVEIHTTHAQGIPPAESWRRLHAGASELVRSGRRFSVPSATELFWNGTAHALRIPDVAFILVHLLDTAVIWASGTPLDWGEIVRRLDAKEIVDTAAAASWLRAAADLAGVTPPPELERRLAVYDLPRALELRLAILRRVPLPAAWNKLLIWWSTERARRGS